MHAALSAEQEGDPGFAFVISGGLKVSMLIKHDHANVSIFNIQKSTAKKLHP